MKRLLFLFLSLFLLQSCIHSRKTIKQHTVLDTLDVKVGKPEEYEYRASATHTWDITHTRAALSFNWKEKTANGQVWIDLHPYFYATDSLVLDAKGMRIDSVYSKCHVQIYLGAGRAINEGSVPVFSEKSEISSYTYKDDQLKIKFKNKLQNTDTIQLYVKYLAMPYAEAAGGSAAITEDRGLYFINTDQGIPGKPVQIWTQGETESNSHWLPTIDKPNTRFTTQIELTVPDTMVTLSNGYLAKSLKEKDAQRTDIWKMDLPIQDYAIMFAIGKFSVIKEHWKDKEVNYYVEPAYAPYASKMFNHTPEMIEYFSNVTGVLYPWNKYSQVVVRDYVSGAMENTSATLLGEFVNQNFREIADKGNEDVVSHELFHQWFGDYVTCESWSNLTLNESFANYGEQLWRGYKYGKTYAEKLAADDLQQYLSAATYSDPNLVRFYYSDREKMFDRTTYQKGGAILHYLHSLMGDTAFSKSMQVYLTKNALHSAEATQWRLAIEEVTGQDWNWFFNEWYYHGGHPALDLKYNYNDSAQVLKVTVLQVQPDSSLTYQLPLKTAVYYGRDKSVVDWNIKKRKEVYAYPYKDGRRPVIIPDYTHVLVGSITDNKEPAQWLQQFQSSGDYRDKRKCFIAPGYELGDTASQTILTLALSDSISFIREQALTLLSLQRKEKWQAKWRLQVEYLAQYDGSNDVRAAAFAVMGQWKLGTEKETMMNAIWDSSYAVAGAALGALYAIDSDKAYDLAKQILQTNPQGSLFNNTWSIIGKKANDPDIALFREHAPYYYGTKKGYFNRGLYNYLLRVNNDASFEKGLQIMKGLILHDNISGYRTGYFSSIIELAKDYKGRLAASSTKEETNFDKERLDLIKDYIQKIIDAEKDPGNVKEYKRMYKNI